MRQVFSSQRVETVEGVAKLLRDAGIEVRVTNGRSYRSKRSGQFSYLDKGNDKNHPAVWVVHANDQPAARELLRDARLIDTTRNDQPGLEYAFRDDALPARPRNWAWRIRIGLLVLIAGIALFIMIGGRGTPPAPVAEPVAPVAAPAPAAQDSEVRVRIQPPAN